MKKILSKIWSIKLQLLFVVIFITLILYMTVAYKSFILSVVKNPTVLRGWIEGYGKWGILAFIILQIIQVIGVVIPGEVIQVAGGYVYGTFWGTLFSIIGITAGSICCFFIARAIGFTALKKLISKEKLDKFDYIINNPKGEMTLFALLLIPAAPKDILSYVAGITPIKFYKYFFITIIARLPGIVYSAFIGSNIYNKNYVFAFVISVVAIIIFVVCMVKGNNIINWFNSLNKKNIKNR